MSSFKYFHLDYIIPISELFRTLEILVENKKIQIEIGIDIEIDIGIEVR